MAESTVTQSNPVTNLTCPRCKAPLDAIQVAPGNSELILVRRQPPPKMTIEELEAIIDLCGTCTAAARFAGCSAKHISGCRNGRGHLSLRCADALRSAIAEGRHLEGPRLCSSRKGGRPRSESVMTNEELEAIISMCGSMNAAARKVGCSRAYLSRCRRGHHPVSQRIADALRAIPA